jgi:hypothetical protein
MNKFCVVILLLGPSACRQPAREAPKSYEEENVVHPLNLSISAAIGQEGEAYERAELQIRQTEQTVAVSALEQHRSDDPVAASTCQALVESVTTQRQAFDKAIAYLAYLPKRMASTPAGSPRPDFVPKYFNHEFKRDLVLPMALRLVKSHDWPMWKFRGVLLYVTTNPEPQTLPLLLRLTAKALDPRDLEILQEHLDASEQDALRNAVLAEMRYWLLQNQEIPPTIRTYAQRFNLEQLTH